MKHHPLPQTEINKRLRRAWKNRERLHLDEDLARHLMDPRIYAVFAQIEAEEMRKTWQSNHDSSGDDHPEPPKEPDPPRGKPTPANDFSSGRSTSGIAKTATNGPSSGGTVAERAARRRVSRVADQLRQTLRERRTPPRKSSPITGLTGRLVPTN